MNTTVDIRKDKITGEPILWQPVLVYEGPTTLGIRSTVNKSLPDGPCYCRNYGIRACIRALESGKYPDAIGYMLLRAQEVPA